MTYPRCSLPGLLLYVSYITSYGLWQCVLSSSNLPANYNVKHALRVPGSIASFKPWFESYVTNPNLVYSTTSSGQAAPYKTSLSPQDVRIALKKSPGNYLYPDIPGHRAPIHACLAGYDSEIYSIMNEIRATSGNEIEIHFYLFQSCKFHLLGSHLTTVKDIQDILGKYHHYICLNKKYVESYSEKDNCWYIEKLIMLPSLNREFESLPEHIKAQDFNKIYNSRKPVTLEIDEKVNPEQIGYIQKIIDYDNKYEVKLDDIASGKRKVYKNNKMYTDNADIKYDTQYSQVYTPYSSYSTTSNLKQSVYSSNSLNLPNQIQQIPGTTAVNLPAKEISDFSQKYDTKYSNLPPRSVTSVYTAPTLKYVPETYTTSQATKVVQASEYIPVISSTGSPVTYASSQKINQQSYNKVSTYTPANVSPSRPMNIIKPGKNQQEVLNSIPWDFWPRETKDKEGNVNYVTPYTKPGKIIPFAPSPTGIKGNYDFVGSYTPQQKTVMPGYDTVTLQQKPVEYASSSGYPSQSDKHYAVYYANKQNKGGQGQYISSGQYIKPARPNNLVTYIPEQIAREKFPEYFQGPYSSTSQGSINNFQIQKPKWPSYQTVSPLYRGQDNGVEVPSYDTIWARPTLSAIRPQTWPKNIGRHPVYMTSFKPVQGIGTIGYGKPNIDVISSYTLRENVATSGISTADNFPQNVLKTNLVSPYTSKPEYFTVGEDPLVIHPDFKVNSDTNSEISASPKNVEVLTDVPVVRPIQHLRTHAIGKPQKGATPQPYTSPSPYQNKIEYKPFGYAGEPSGATVENIPMSQFKPSISSTHQWQKSPKSITQDYVSIPNYTQRTLGEYSGFGSKPLFSQQPSKALPYYTERITKTSPDFVSQDSSSGFTSIPSYTQRPSEIDINTPNIISQSPTSYGPAYSLGANQIRPEDKTVPVAPWNQKPKGATENIAYVPSYKQQPIATPKYDSIPSYSQTLKPELTSVVQPYIQPSKGTPYKFVTIPSYSQQSFTVQSDSVSVLPYSEQSKAISQNYVSIPTYTSSPVKVRPTIVSTFPRYQRPQHFVSIPSYTQQPTYTGQPSKLGPHLTSQQPFAKDLVSIPKYSQWPVNILKTGTSVPSYTTLLMGTTQEFKSIPSYTQLPLKTKPVSATVLPHYQWPRRKDDYVSIPFYSQIPSSTSPKLQSYATPPVDTGFSSPPSFSGQISKPNFVSAQPYLIKPKSDLQGFTSIPSYTQRPLMTTSGTEPISGSSGFQSRPTYVSRPVDMISTNSQTSSKQEYVEFFASYPIKRIQPLKTHAIFTPQKGPAPQPYRSPYSPYQNKIYNKIEEYQPIEPTREPIATALDNNRSKQKPTGVTNDYVSIPSYTKQPTVTSTVTDSSITTQPLEITPYVEVPTDTQRPSNVSPTPYSKSLYNLQPKRFDLIPSSTRQLPKWPYVQPAKSLPQEFVSIPSYTQKPTAVSTAYKTQYAPQRMEKPIATIPSYSQKLPLAPVFVSGVPPKRPTSATQNYITIPSYTQQPLEIPYSQWPKGVSHGFDSQQMIPIVSVVPQDSANIPYAFPNQVGTQSGIRSKPYYTIQPTGTSPDSIQSSSYTPGALEERPQLISVQNFTKPPRRSTQNFVSYTQQPLRSRQDSNAAPYTYYTLPGKIQLGPIPPEYAIPSYTKLDTSYTSIPSYSQEPVAKPSVYDPSTQGSYDPSHTQGPGPVIKPSYYDPFYTHGPSEKLSVFDPSTQEPGDRGSKPSGSMGVPPGYNVISDYTLPSDRQKGSPGFYSQIPRGRLVEYVSIPSYDHAQELSSKPSVYDPSRSQEASNRASRPSGSMEIPPEYDVIPSYTQPVNVPTSYVPPVVRPIETAGVPQGYNALPSYSQILGGKPLGPKGESTKYNSISSYTPAPSGFDPSYFVVPIASGYTRRSDSKPCSDTIPSYTRPGSTPSISTSLPSEYKSIPLYTKSISWPTRFIRLPSGYAIPSYFTAGSIPIKPIGVSQRYNAIPKYTKPCGWPSRSIGVPLAYDVVPSYSSSDVKPVGSTGVLSGYDVVPSYLPSSAKPIGSTGVPSGYDVVPSYSSTSGKPLGPIRPSSGYYSIPTYTKAVSWPSVSSYPLLASPSPLAYDVVPSYSPSGVKPIASTGVPSGYDVVPSYLPASAKPIGSTGVPSGYDVVPSYSSTSGKPLGPIRTSSGYYSIPTYTKAVSWPSVSSYPLLASTSPLAYDVVPSYSPSRVKPIASTGVPSGYDVVPSYLPSSAKPIGSTGVPSGYSVVPSYSPSGSKPIGSTGVSSGYDVVSSYSPSSVKPIGSTGVFSKYDVVPFYPPAAAKPIRSKEITSGYDVVSSYSPSGIKPIGSTGVPLGYDVVPSYSPSGIKPIASIGVPSRYDLVPSYPPSGGKPLGSTGVPSGYDVVPSYFPSGVKPIGSTGVPSGYDVVPSYSPSGVKPIGSTGIPSGYDVVPSYSSSGVKPIGSTGVPSGYDVVPSYPPTGGKPLGPCGVPSRFDVVPSYSPSDVKPVGSTRVPSGYDIVPSYSPSGSKPIGSTGVPSEYDVVPSYSPSSDKPIISTSIPPGSNVVSSYSTSGGKPLDPSEFPSGYEVITSNSPSSGKPIGSTAVPAGYDVVPSYSAVGGRPLGPIEACPGFTTIPSYTQQGKKPTGSAGLPLQYDTSYALPGGRPSEYNPSYSRSPYYIIPSPDPECKRTKVPLGFTTILSYSPKNSRPSEYTPSYTQKPSGTPTYDTISSYTNLGSVPSKVSVGVSPETIPCYSRPGSRPMESETFFPEYNAIPSFSQTLGKRPQGERPFEFAAIPLKYNTIPSYTPLSGKLGPVVTSPSYNAIPSYTQPGIKPSEFARVPSEYVTIPTYVGPVSKPSGDFPGYSTIPSYRPLGPIGVRPVYNTIPSYTRPVTTKIGSAGVPYTSIPCNQISRDGKLSPDGRPLEYDTIQSYSQVPDNKPSGPYYSKIPSGTSSYSTIPSYSSPMSRPVGTPQSYEKISSYTSPLSRPVGTSQGYETIPSYTGPGRRPGEGYPSYETISSHTSPGRFPARILTGPSRIPLGYDTIPYYTDPSRPAGASPGLETIYSNNRPKSRVTGIFPEYVAIPSYTSPSGRLLGPIGISPLYTKPGIQPSRLADFFPEYYKIPSFSQQLGVRPSYYNIPSYTDAGSRPMESIPLEYNVLPCLNQKPGGKPLDPKGESLGYVSILSNLQGPVGRSPGYNPSSYYPQRLGGKPSYETISSYTSPTSRLSGVPPGYEIIPSYTGPGSKLAGVPSVVKPLDNVSSYTQDPDGRSSYDAILPGSKPTRASMYYDAIPSYSPRDVRLLDLTRVPPGYDAILSYGPSGPIRHRAGYITIPFSNAPQTRPTGEPLSYDTFSSYTSPGSRPSGLPQDYNAIPSYTRPSSRPIEAIKIPLKYDVIPSYSQKLGGMPSSIESEPLQYQSISSYTQRPTSSNSGYSSIPTYTQTQSSRPIKTQEVPLGYDYISSYTQAPKPTGSIPSYSQGPTPLGYESISSYKKEPTVSGSGFGPIGTSTQKPCGRPIESQTVPLRYHSIPSYTQRPKPSWYTTIPIYTQRITPSGPGYGPITSQGPGSKPLGSQEVPIEYVSIPSYTQTSPSGFLSVPSNTQGPATTSFEKQPSVSIPYYTQRPAQLEYNTIPLHSLSPRPKYSSIISYTQGPNGRPIGFRGPIRYNSSGFGRVPSGSISSSGPTPSKYESIPTYTLGSTPTGFKKGQSGSVPSYRQLSSPSEYETIPSYSQPPTTSRSGYYYNPIAIFTQGSGGKPIGSQGVPTSIESASLQYQAIPAYTQRPVPYSSGYSPMPTYSQAPSSRPIKTQEVPPGYDYISLYTQGPKQSRGVPSRLIPSSTQELTPSEYYTIPSYTPRPLRPGFNPLGSIPSFNKEPTMSGYTSIPYTKGSIGRPSGFNKIPTGYYSIPSYTQKSKPLVFYGPMPSYNNGQGFRPTGSGDVPLGYYSIPYYSALPLRTLPGFRSIPSYTTTTPATDTQQPAKTWPDLAKTIPSYQLPKSLTMPSMVKIPFVGHKKNLHDKLKSLKSKLFLQNPEELTGLYDTLSSLNRFKGPTKYMPYPQKGIYTGQFYTPYGRTGVLSSTKVPYSTVNAPYSQTGTPYTPITGQTGQTVLPYSKPYQTIPEYSGIPAYTSRLPTESLTKYEPIIQYTKPYVPNAPSEQPFITLRQPGLPWVPYGKLSSITNLPSVPYTATGIPYTSTVKPSTPYTTTGIPYTTTGQPSVPYTATGIPYTSTVKPSTPYTTTGIPYTTTGQPSVPFISTGQPIVPYTATRQPSIPYKATVIPCTSSVISSTPYSVNTKSAPYAIPFSVGQYVSPTQSYNTARPYTQPPSQYPTIYQQPTDKTNGYNIDNDELCKALQVNNMTNINNIDLQTLIDRVKHCMANSLLKTNVSDKQLKDQCVPLDDIVVANTRFENQKPFFSKTINGVEVKGYMNKVKVLKAKIVYEADEVDVPNFVPVVKCGDTRDPKLLQNLVANMVKSVYNEEPVLLKGPGPTDQDHLVMKNLHLDREKAFIWPAVCENNVHYSHKGSCPRCRQYCQCCQL